MLQIKEHNRIACFQQGQERKKSKEKMIQHGFTIFDYNIFLQFIVYFILQHCDIVLTQACQIWIF